MRILIITSSFHPLTGGAETYARLLARSLAESGHAVVVVTDGSWLPDLPPRGREEGYEVIRLRQFAAELDRRDKARWRQIVNSVPTEIGALLGDFRPDVVHANSHETLIWAAEIALELDAVLAASLHEQNPDHETFGVGRCRLAYQVLPVDVYFAASEFYLSRARAYDVPVERLHLVYHGVDTQVGPAESREETRARVGLEPDAFLLLCPGRIYRRKAQLDLVRALPDILAVEPRAHLLLAGRVSDFDYAACVREEIVSLGVTRHVTIDEDLTSDDMTELYCAADVVVQPSLEEGLGLAAIEAMAQARPVVGTDVVGLREVLTDDIDSIVVPAEDPDQIARAVIRVARDPDLAERLASNARATVLRRFDRHIMAAQTLAGYQAGMASRRPRVTGDDPPSSDSDPGETT